MSALENTARTFAIHAYRYATLPLRAINSRRAFRAGKVPVYALFFHRVCNHTPNHWTISVDQFEKQICWLSKNFDLVPLEEAQRRIRSGHNTRPTLALTFDDGYADNSQHALPLLIKRGIPFTYFVCLQNILTDTAFLHDIELGKPLSPHDVASIRQLAASPLVEIGAHTRNHINIGAQPDAQKIFDEVITSSRELERLTGQPMRYFAFPFGNHENMSAAVFHLLQEHGFEGVVSAYGGLNEIGGDAFHIQRLHGDPMFARIQNWLTGDPRVRKTRRFEYQTDEQTRTQWLRQFTQINRFPEYRTDRPTLPIVDLNNATNTAGR